MSTRRPTSAGRGLPRQDATAGDLVDGRRRARQRLPAPPLINPTAPGNQEAEDPLRLRLIAVLGLPALIFAACETGSPSETGARDAETGSGGATGSGSGGASAQGGSGGGTGAGGTMGVGGGAGTTGAGGHASGGAGAAGSAGTGARAAAPEWGARAVRQAPAARAEAAGSPRRRRPDCRCLQVRRTWPSRAARRATSPCSTGPASRAPSRTPSTTTTTRRLRITASSRR